MTIPTSSVSKSLDSAIIEIVLRKVEARFNDGSYRDDELNYNVDLDVKRSFDIESNLLTVSMRVRVIILGVKDVTVGKVEIQYDGVFDFSTLDTHDESSIDFFLERSAIPAIYPYVRQSLTDVVSRARIPPIYLPMLEQVSSPDASAEK